MRGLTMQVGRRDAEDGGEQSPGARSAAARLATSDTPGDAVSEHDAGLLMRHLVAMMWVLIALAGYMVWKVTRR